ncbi:ParA family protein, partial [Actinomyces bouchesdurhonensis]|uniref:ParA family protein n=1 Tax=Actinomyces bouchesdurhonensis TaxID=1852361 RepID=UPI0036F31C53
STPADSNTSYTLKCEEPVNAFAAADGILVVSQSRLYSATGLAHLLNTVEAVHAYYNPSVSLMGVIVNQHRARTRQGAHWVDELTTACRKRGLRLFDPPIPDAVAISDAAESGMGLDEWPGAAKLASLYDAHLSTLLAAGSGVL